MITKRGERNQRSLQDKSRKMGRESEKSNSGEKMREQVSGGKYDNIVPQHCTSTSRGMAGI